MLFSCIQTALAHPLGGRLKGSGSQPADGSGAMFDAIARRYDRINRILSLGMDQSWRRKTALALTLEAGDRVLDLATGTADLALVVARNHATSVIGLDPSPEMLRVGRTKIGRAGLEAAIRLQQGDAQDLPFADDSFDAVTMAFGIRNVPDRCLALTEMARVTRPGGGVAILELSEPGRGPLASLARFHVHWLVPRLGALLSGAPEYRYLQRSIAEFPAASDFAALMERSGLHVRQVRRLSLGACHLFVATPAARDEVAQFPQGSPRRTL